MVILPLHHQHTVFFISFFIAYKHYNAFISHQPFRILKIKCMSKVLAMESLLALLSRFLVLSVDHLINVEIIDLMEK